MTPGAPFGYWQVSEVSEARYDLPDQPMEGEMDSFFFLTRDRNFIPHEYPCRTRFAQERRQNRPEVRGERAFVRNWLPFGSPRLDLSGFWFRPTRVAAWARTVVAAYAAGTARMRLATCGGAVLYAGGREVGWIADYVRNKESAVEFDVPLQAGENEIVVFLDDLAERDTRFYLELTWLGGMPASQVLPFEADPALVRAVEATLSAMHFELPAYTRGDVVVALPCPLPVDARVAIAVEGDFMSHQRLALSRDLAAGAARLPIAQAETLPADFRHFRLTVDAGGFVASRVLGVEIAHADADGEAPDGQPDRAAAAQEAVATRAAAALEVVATRAEPDTVCALARLATGRADDTTAAMIDAALGPIADCWDCADFAVVPLIWARSRWGEDLSEAQRARIDATILGYRYWMDEPGNDVQWYFSENHALLFHTAAYLSGHLLPDAVFRRSGRSGIAQCAIGRDRVRAWLDHFERWEMAEFNSAPYFPIDLKGLTALFALAPDADIRARAGRGIVRLLELVANSAHHGVLTAAQGRSYEHTLRAALSLELSAIGRLAWGRGSYGSRFHATPQMALCLRDHGLVLPPDLAQRAIHDRTGEREWFFTQGQDGFAHLYHAKSADWAMGSAAHYRWYEWGYQETLIQARIGTEPQAQVWVNHPGEVIHSGYGRPSFWGGSASIPRVQQYRGLAIVVFDGVAPQPDFTHAWFPRPVFDESDVDGCRAFARSGRGALALIADGPLEEIVDGPGARCELRHAGRSGRWILRVGAAAGLAAFRDRFGGLSMAAATDGTIAVDDPEYGRVAFHDDGSVSAEGRRLDPAAWTLAGECREIATEAAAHHIQPARP